MRTRSLRVVLGVLAAVMWLATSPGDSDGQSPRKGGALRVGMTSEPPMLDAHATTTVITRDMLTVKRPGFGIKPKLLDLVIGRVASVDIEEDTVLTWEML